jgi:hypothetical protein
METTRVIGGTRMSTTMRAVGKRAVTEANEAIGKLVVRVAHPGPQAAHRWQPSR